MQGSRIQKRRKSLSKAQKGHIKNDISIFMNKQNSLVTIIFIADIILGHDEHQ